MNGKDRGLCGDLKIDLMNDPPPGGHPALKSPRNPHNVVGILYSYILCSSSAESNGCIPHLRRRFNLD